MYTKFEDYITENKSHSVIVYHGGELPLSNNTLKESPIFFTTNLESAKWYADRASEGGEGYLITAKVSIRKPLTCDNLIEFKQKWIPILDDSNIDYTLEEDDDGRGWSFESSDIIGNGGYEETNIFDLSFIPNFVKTAKYYGYDGIVGDDTFERYDIKVYIPFNSKKQVSITKCKSYEPTEND